AFVARAGNKGHVQSRMRPPVRCRRSPVVAICCSPAHPNTMPPRYITLVIIAFWMVMSGWLFYSDLWPRLRPGQPPPYAIDLVDEARFRESTNDWVVLQNGRDIGYAKTWVDYRAADDTFKLNGQFKL